MLNKRQVTVAFRESDIDVPAGFQIDNPQWDSEKSSSDWTAGAPPPYVPITGNRHASAIRSLGAEVPGAPYVCLGSVLNRARYFVE
jgi:hypothetical protein